MLRLSYQLQDASGRTAVNAVRMKLVPVISYAPGSAPSGEVNATANELPGCAVGTVDPISGIGECTVPLDARFFPATGSLTANIALQLRTG
jgi:hypothetical protein